MNFYDFEFLSVNLKDNHENPLKYREPAILVSESHPGRLLNKYLMTGPYPQIRTIFEADSDLMKIVLFSIIIVIIIKHCFEAPALYTLYMVLHPINQVTDFTHNRNISKLF